MIQTARLAAAAIEARRVSIRYARSGGEPLCVLEDFSLRVAPFEVVAVVGPNGAGKTTLLQVLAGLVPPDCGEVHCTARAAIVFQDYSQSLLPWRTNLDNVALPLQVAGMSRKAREAQVRERLAAFSGESLLAELGIEPHGYPYTLSGGQRQWLSILRAYITDPEVVLLDEPFAALDLHGRLLARARLAKLQQHKTRTTVIVSHDLEEAVYLADRVLVLSRPPARVLLELPVTFPRPRPRLAQMLEDARYVELCRQLRATFLKASGA